MPLAAFPSVHKKTIAKVIGTRMSEPDQFRAEVVDGAIKMNRNVTQGKANKINVTMR